MKWSIILYGVALGVMSLLLTWLDFRHFTHVYSTQIYISLIAVIFVCLGIWIGNRLAPNNTAPEFSQNTKALEYLGISSREYEVLTLLSEGASNKLIARKLNISPNTVKTHVTRLYEKLAAQNRTEATKKARELQIIA